MQCDGLTGSPRNSQQERGQEDQRRVKELRGTLPSLFQGFLVVLACLLALPWALCQYIRHLGDQDTLKQLSLNPPSLFCPFLVFLIFLVLLAFWLLPGLHVSPKFFKRPLKGLLRPSRLSWVPLKRLPNELGSFWPPFWLIWVLSI